MKYVIAAIIVLVAGFVITHNTKQPVSETQTEPEVRQYTSRSWHEHTQSIVIDSQPTPPESARLYAYVATAFHQTLEATGSVEEASLATRDVLNMVAPEYVESTNDFFSELTGTDEVTLSEEASEISEALRTRAQTDGFVAVADTDIERPTETEFWIGEEPLSPAALAWESWVLREENDPSAPVPPIHGSEEHQAALAEVKESTITEGPQRVAAINFWAGGPGTIAPAGIWQNRMYEEIGAYDLSESEYSYAQMVLAQALADSFIEAWEEKYTYWTKRPSMDDPELRLTLQMENPHFPSYVSGHSTISRTAAEVLLTMFPEKEELWLREAAEARDTRLWSGVHFRYDNDAGFDLGAEVGRQVVSELGVEVVWPQ